MVLEITRQRVELVVREKGSENLRKESAQRTFNTVISNRRTEQTHFRRML